MNRLPAFSGSFYSASSTGLAKDIAKLLTTAKVPSKVTQAFPSPLGFVVPHAGYVYSGYTAAHAYKMMKELEYDTAILLGPSHHAYVDGYGLYVNGDFESPVGSLSVDTETTSFLLKRPQMSIATEAHLAEHSLEVQIPFLRTVKPGIKIVPILLGDYRLNNLQVLAKNLVETIENFPKKRIVFLISTDLSHYHSAEAADRMDSQFIQLFKDFKIKDLIEGVNTNKLEACGSGPVIALMLLAQALKRTKVEILSHTNSAKSSGDYKRVVGYFSAVVG